jgi:spermidine/putrescine transport system substrate-binding protein
VAIASIRHRRLRLQRIIQSLLLQEGQFGMNPQRFTLHQSRRYLVSKTRRRLLQVVGAALSATAFSGYRASSAEVRSSPTSNSSISSNTLHIYTWSDYLDAQLLNDFREATGINVIADIFDSNEAMLARLQAGEGNAYSIIYPSDYVVSLMVELDMLVELDQSRLRGMDDLLDKFRSPVYDPGNVHSIPVSWGTAGLLYNAEQLNPSPQDWNYLWENKDQLSRRMTLLNDVREVMGMALKSLGYSYNSTNPVELEQAFNKLNDLKEAIASFQSDGWEDQLLFGDLALCMTYSVVGNAMAREHQNLKYVVPKNGTSIWTDAMVIPKSASNVDAAYAWINFMLTPENAAQIIERFRFATASRAAIDLLPDELRLDTNLFPGEAFLNNCEQIAPVGEAAVLYDSYWTELTSG